MNRFPTPDFESGYTLPPTLVSSPRSVWLEHLDVLVLLAALGLTAWLVLRYRRRWAITVTMLACLAYFGFWKKGCVCPIGAVQNVAAALGDASFGLPLAVLLFFLAPLVAALLFGRVFCGAVCPLGAIQDAVIIRPVRLPAWLKHGLGIFPYLFLGVAVLLAYAGAGFVICRYDPFVGFFRLAGTMPLLIFGGVLLAVGTIIARPYCRFICPYGVLLGWASALGWKRVRVSPDDCVACRLCETVCPFDAIRKPEKPDAAGVRSARRRRFAFYLVLTPLLTVAAAWGGTRLMQAVSRVDPRVALVVELDAEAGVSGGWRSRAFREADGSEVEARAVAAAVTARLERAGLGLGALIGLMLGIRLAGLAVGRRRDGYEPDPAECLACGRCFAVCPREHVRRSGAACGVETKA